MDPLPGYVTACSNSWSSPFKLRVGKELLKGLFAVCMRQLFVEEWNGRDLGSREALATVRVRAPLGGGIQQVGAQLTSIILVDVVHPGGAGLPRSPTIRGVLFPGR